MATIRTAVVGAGKMGSIHAKVCHSLPECQLVAVVDSDAGKARALADRYGCPCYGRVEDILDRVDAVTVATPTATHLDLAKVLLRRRIPVLIEKPLAASAALGRQIAALARRYDTVVAVGHSERCNPAVQAVCRLAVEPRFIETVRVSPFPFRSMDVGVVLDVMIHDIDIVLSLAASPLRRVEAVGGGVVGQEEDLCNARLVFANGCVASLTASRLALKTERRLRVFTRRAFLSADCLKKTAVIITAEANEDQLQWIRQHVQSGDIDPTKTQWPDLVRVEPLSVDDKEPIRLEQEAFLNAVRDRTARPQVTVAEGLEALRCAEKIIAAVNRHPWH